MTEEKTDAYHEGVQASRSGRGLESCPYGEGRKDIHRRLDWMLGWHQAEEASPLPTQLPAGTETTA